MKKATTDKENDSVSNVKSEKVEKPKIAMPASIKKAEVNPPGYLRVMSLKVAELRVELRQRKLDTTGLKKDLQKRLLEDIAAAEDKQKESSKSLSNSVTKAKKPFISSPKDGDGDVRMKDAQTTGSDRDSGKMDVDEDTVPKMNKEYATKAFAKKGAAQATKAGGQDTTVAKSFLKSTADLFSPSKIAAKIHSMKREEGVMEKPVVVAKETNEKPEALQPGRNSLADGLKKTASAILSASPARKATPSHLKKSPFSKGSAGKVKPVLKRQEATVEETTSA